MYYVCIIHALNFGVKTTTTTKKKKRVRISYTKRVC